MTSIYLFLSIIAIQCIYTSSFMDIFLRSSKKEINNIDFDILSKTDKECLYHYNKYVKPFHKSMNETILFSDYLEYWWNLEENDNELLKRVCVYIYDKYPNKYD